LRRTAKKLPERSTLWPIQGISFKLPKASEKYNVRLQSIFLSGSDLPIMLLEAIIRQDFKLWTLQKVDFLRGGVRGFNGLKVDMLSSFLKLW